jgi:hypothetical protein
MKSMLMTLRQNAQRKGELELVQRINRALLILDQSSTMSEFLQAVEEEGL